MKLSLNINDFFLEYNDNPTNNLFKNIDVTNLENKIYDYNKLKFSCLKQCDIFGNILFLEYHINDDLIIVLEKYSYKDIFNELRNLDFNLKRVLLKQFNFLNKNLINIVFDKDFDTNKILIIGFRDRDLFNFIITILKKEERNKNLQYFINKNRNNLKLSSMNKKDLLLFLKKI